MIAFESALVLKRTLLSKKFKFNRLVSALANERLDRRGH
jgi:hypothetical protein